MKVVLLIVFLLALSLISFSLPLSGMLTSGPRVVRIVDGDTVVLDSGERVRLLGIDTPEKGQPYAADASDFLTTFALGKRVSLQTDITEKDKYGRLLRYLWVDGKLAEEELLRRGLATVLIIPPDRLYEERLRNVEDEAHMAERGVWTLTKEYCIGVYGVHSNARGKENENLNDEWVSFRNKCTRSIPLTHWTFSDSRHTIFSFPTFVLDKKSIVTVHTGTGKNNATDLFWGQTNAVWNNGGDTVLVWDDNRLLQLNYSYQW